jgi:hypothetical protein
METYKIRKYVYWKYCISMMSKYDVIKNNWNVKIYISIKIICGRQNKYPLYLPPSRARLVIAIAHLFHFAECAGSPCHSLGALRRRTPQETARRTGS